MHVVLRELHPQAKEVTGVIDVVLEHMHQELAIQAVALALEILIQMAIKILLAAHAVIVSARIVATRDAFLRVVQVVIH